MRVKSVCNLVSRGWLCTSLGFFLFSAVAQIPAPETIPDPADGPYLFVAPTERTGVETVSVVMTGLDATAVYRSYDLPFDTDLTDIPSGAILIIR